MDVSICITTYNHEKYIRESLESIFAQEFSGTYEIIIGNDNSSDGTEKIIRQMMTHSKGGTVRYFKNNPNLGYVKNTLFTFSQAQGKYITILDGDDKWIDTKKIQKQFDFLEENTDFSAVGSDSKVVYEDLPLPDEKFTSHGGKVLEKADLTDTKIMQTSTFFFRKDILKDDFPTDIISADRCLYLLAGCFGKVKVLPEQTAVYRQFSGSISKNVTSEMMKKDFLIIPFIKKYGDGYSTFRLKRYFFYTLMSYSTVINKFDFYNAATGYFITTVLAKFTLKPRKMYSVLKWASFTVNQKYQAQKEKGIL